MDTSLLDRDWPTAKIPAPATITMDGFPIHDVLTTVQQQLQALHTVAGQQAQVITDMKKREEEVSSLNVQYEERIAALEEQLRGNAVAELNSRIAAHDTQIEALENRPIIDAEQTERLSVVERKLASFYGDDTNILGRVAHLENQQRKDNHNMDEMRGDLRKLSGQIDFLRREADNLKRTVNVDHEDSIKGLWHRKMDNVDLSDMIRHTLDGMSVPTRGDVSTMENMVNSVVEETRELGKQLRQECEGGIQGCITRLDGHDADIKDLNSRTLAHPMGTPMQPSNGQASADTVNAATRLASMESRLSRLDTDHDRLVRVENQCASNRAKAGDMEAQYLRLKVTQEHLEDDIARIREGMDETKRDIGKLEYRYDHDTNLLHAAEVTSSLNELKTNISALQHTVNQDHANSIGRIEAHYVDTAGVKQIISAALNKHVPNLSPSQSPSPGLDFGEDSKRVSDVAKELERRMRLLVEEFHRALETVQTDTRSGLKSIAKYVENSLPPCDCDDNRPPSSGGGDVPTSDPLLLLSYRRCKRQCPACVEKERKMGLPDLSPSDNNGGLADRVTKLEENGTKVKHIVDRLKDAHHKALKSNDEISHEITELKQIVTVEHKTQLQFLAESKMNNQDIHDIIFDAVSKEGVPSVSDIEALKNLCSLVASECRDALEGFKTKTDKKFKAVGVHLGNHDDELAELKSSSQATSSTVGEHGVRLSALEGKSTGEDRGGGGDTGGLRSKLSQVEHTVTSIQSKLSYQEEDRKKQRALIDAIRSDMNALQHTVNVDHHTSLQKLLKKRGDFSDVGTLVEDAMKRYLEQHKDKTSSTNSTGNVSVDEMDKIKRFVREVDRKLSTLADECREQFDDIQKDSSERGQRIADTFKKIIDYINGLSKNGHHRPEIYIPSFPDSRHIEKKGTPKPGSVPTLDLSAKDSFPTGREDTRLRSPDALRETVRNGRESDYIDSAEDFDNFVKASMNFSSTHPKKSETDKSVLNRRPSTAPRRKKSWNPRSHTLY
mmetsp:Transcript_10774/g.16378  ORF Transcript_10774/g.16378 Transcript_10774/m.16378 type:complete len:1008 (+) Transcript_10774:167-3190(+)|eukprot:CAMPEP_0185022880 /NCGR_PEP_ID=MMETSP1103-20130426/5581_1 /TAXON_ID=36769 /ORGANISM="Paraphysomonas bandaiensis, Strain Caron Lab Isolate" /LENGTH=1007 /DNA_ID=CAMNT_0027555161 /DNA_START=154 /DNA_END=3177 /DNA_ORIENTATION=-